MLAADGFAQGEKNVVIAKRLRGSTRSVERWRRSWREGGRGALCRSGPAKRPKVGDRDFAALEPVLLEGAMAQGWTDERWTLSRVQLLIADQLRVSCTGHYGVEPPVGPFGRLSRICTEDEEEGVGVPTHGRVPSVLERIGIHVRVSLHWWEPAGGSWAVKEMPHVSLTQATAMQDGVGPGAPGSGVAEVQHTSRLHTSCEVDRVDEWRATESRSTGKSSQCAVKGLIRSTALQKCADADPGSERRRPPRPPGGRTQRPLQQGG
ncbi:hypothetical protein ACFZDK_34505 [Streptomyces sp. NPDC007901]|uniref:hypothetical protein n=1 Tax=Streptomyces sp. NPDC007901 TaxID=3364785 RepID=UPI0036EBE0F0